MCFVSAARRDGHRQSRAALAVRRPELAQDARAEVLLPDERDGAAILGRVAQQRFVRRGHEADHDRRQVRRDPPGRLVAVDVGQAHVHQDDVGVESDRRPPRRPRPWRPHRRPRTRPWRRPAHGQPLGSVAWSSTVRTRTEPTAYLARLVRGRHAGFVSRSARGGWPRRPGSPMAPTGLIAVARATARSGVATRIGAGAHPRRDRRQPRASARYRRTAVTRRLTTLVVLEAELLEDRADVLLDGALR